MEKRIVVHVPFKILNNHPSGTQLRPVEIASSFERLGFKVHFVEGKAKERKKKINEIKKLIDSGVRFEFVYSESSTSPTLLTESHHLPSHPFLDFGFFKYCFKRDIPIGLFYRDIYWMFPFYGRGLPFWKKLIARLFYRLDLKMYQKYLAALFIPNMRMKAFIPVEFDMPVRELPPALKRTNFSLDESNNSQSLHLFYVGGIGAHYNFHKLFLAINSTENVKLTVCCREEEWMATRNQYEPFTLEDIEIVHEKGDGLIPHFNRADVLMLFVEPTVYWQFAMPLKLFEYISYGKPIIASKGTAVAEFIESNSIGWTIEYDESKLVNCLNQIDTSSNDFLEKTRRIQSIAAEHTWENRAKSISNSLIKI